MVKFKRWLFLAPVVMVISIFSSCFSVTAHEKVGHRVENSMYSLSWPMSNIVQFTYTIKESGKQMNIQFPVFELNGVFEVRALSALRMQAEPLVLQNGVVQYSLIGSYLPMPALKLKIEFQVSPDNPVLRFKYTLITQDRKIKLTKSNGQDNITYIKVNTNSYELKEIRLSTFNERFHSSHLQEIEVDKRYFDSEESVMGPILVAKEAQSTYLLAYEHGSQYPDSFFEFKLHADKVIGLRSVKANYVHDQHANGFSSVWFEFAGISGNEDMLATQYRSFVLKYITQNLESRKPYVFYNTWGRQERSFWAGNPYLSTMRLAYTLQEIDKAHEIGIEVYVLDVGWFNKTGDWEVNKQFFPDELKQVKAKLDSYGMKLGLWFNPTVAALSSNIYQRNKKNVMSHQGKLYPANKVWETEESTGICLVSSYWEDFADNLIDLCNEVGLSYFKWDAVEQYGCDDSNHYHGTSRQSLQERADRYAYLQPIYMSKIIDKVCAIKPTCIFDFDITEPGRCFGLQFLSSGKYFIMNNGPYYHNFDLKQQTANSNIFINPGPSRGWFTRSVLTYDKWIPSILFLTHYQPDEPRNSQLLNVASLILGQNGFWGELLQVSNDGSIYIREILDKYKLVRDDITQSRLHLSGAPGDSPEIYEKISPETGRGCIVIFANKKGTYKYISKNKVASDVWQTGGAKIVKHKEGFASISVTFDSPTASIIFFK